MQGTSFVREMRQVPASSGNTFVHGHMLWRTAGLALLAVGAAAAVCAADSAPLTPGDSTRKLPVQLTSQPAVSTLPADVPSAAAVSAGQSTSVALQANSATAELGSASSTSVTVNGQQVPVPHDASFSRMLPGPGTGTTWVQLSTNSSGGGDSSLNVQINSSTTSGG